MGDYYYCGCCICCLSKKKRNAVTKNKEINLMLVQQRKSEQKEIKLLVLGAAESGKTTFMKQMRIIHGEGFSEEERRGYTKLVFQNIFQSMRAMTDAMKMLKIPYANPKNEIHAQQFQNQDIHQITQLEGSCAEAIRHLWADRGFKMCYKRRREYQLLDSTEYFIVNLDRITSEDYTPTDKDILHVRSPSNGIMEEFFSMEKITLRIVDVGAQRGQRRKWIHCIENVTSIIFLASLSEYDQLLEENNNAATQDIYYRMEESLSLFYTTIHSTWFKDSSVILFLNKMDILAEKIQFSDLKTYFPAFEGKPRDAEDAMLFIRSLYQQKADSFENSKVTYSHFICATDNIPSRALLDDVRNTILMQCLRMCSEL